MSDFERLGNGSRIRHPIHRLDTRVKCTEEYCIMKSASLLFGCLSESDIGYRRASMSDIVVTKSGMLRLCSPSATASRTLPSRTRAYLPHPCPAKGISMYLSRSQTQAKSPDAKLPKSTLVIHNLLYQDPSKNSKGSAKFCWRLGRPRWLLWN